MENKCVRYNKNYKKKNDKNLMKLFFNTFKFSKNDINKFILLLQRDVCPY